MTKLESGLRAKCTVAPQREVALIVRTAGDPSSHLARLAELGLTVRQKFRFLPGVAVTGQAGAALALENEGWVQQVEEDRPVQAQKGENR